MKDTYKRYKIDKLIQIAKTTANEALREELLAEANLELRDFSEKHAEECVNYTESFITDCLERDQKVRTRSLVVYEAYMQYCESNNVKPVGRNTFYMFLKDRGIIKMQGRIEGNENTCYFNVRVNHEQLRNDVQY